MRISRLTVVMVLAATACSRPDGPDATQAGGTADGFQFDEATITQLNAGLQSGTYTSAAITQAYLDRISALDTRGPALRSIIAVNPDAMAIAAERDAERKAGRLRGPLHGIPILIKDNIETADKMPTTAGSLALSGIIADRDAFIVQRLRAAGAIILGKTNLSEWANFRSTRSSSGWSGVGGQVRNPYALDRSPCGSSSGTGVAVAANLAVVGVGTETDGSIVCPSAANALVGMKPTIGLVSRSGIVPIAHSQDIAGPMTRTVTDAAILLNALVGEDSADESTHHRAGHREPDYTRFLDSVGFKGARIGVVRAGMTGYNAATDRLFSAALGDMRTAGATVVDSLTLPMGPVGEAEFTILLYEFKADLNKFLADRAAKVPFKSLADVIAFNERDRARSMPVFGQEIFIDAEKKGPLTDKAYRDAVRVVARFRTSLDSLMQRHKLDALVAPTGSPAWVVDHVLGDHFIGASSTAAAVAGYPNITVPMGYDFGLPVGVSFFGRAWSEPTLLRLAYSYEQKTRHRRPPRFLPTADLTGPR